MSNSPYSFKVKDGRLYISYTSDRGVEWIFEKLEVGSTTLLGQVFTITEGENLGASEEGGDSAEFPIGIKDGEYYVINSSVFGTERQVFVHESVVTKLEPEHFFLRQPYFERVSGNKAAGSGSWSQKYIPILPRLERMFTGSIRIGGDLEDSIPFDTFLRVINVFPDREEVKRYIDSRIALILGEYLVPKRNYAEYRDNLIRRRQERLNAVDSSSLLEVTKDYRSEIFKFAHDELKEMLGDSSGYSESAWQKKIIDIILLLYPKYIHKEQNVQIKTDTSHGFADIVLFDAGGYVDLIEIKKPEVSGVGVLRKGMYRNNYTPSRELSGAIMQIEKYSFWLSRWGKSGERELQRKYASQLPPDVRVKIANPVGIIIFGRDDAFGENERQDFEIIRRKYKHVADILTYDDLLRRIENIISFLETS